METLNQYALSRVLESRMKPVKRPGFGNFALLGTTAEALRAAQVKQSPDRIANFTYAQDRVIVKAFEEVREGAAPDAILWNGVLARAFYQRCRERGVDAPDALLGRRLLNVRKNQPRYERHGIKLKPSSIRVPHPSSLPQYAHVIEFAMVRLRYRFGVSIDDILLDSVMGKQFEDLALGMAPQLSPQDIRLGALSIRKSRFLAKKDASVLNSLNPKAFDNACLGPMRLSDTSDSSVPESHGLIELREKNRFLYIARNDNLRPTIHQFRTGDAFAVMANSFWTPDLDQITVQFVAGDEYKGVALSQWERRLIYDREPVFNWPMHKKAA